MILRGVHQVVAVRSHILKHKHSRWLGEDVVPRLLWYAQGQSDAHRNISISLPEVHWLSHSVRAAKVSRLGRGLNDFT